MPFFSHTFCCNAQVIRVSLDMLCYVLLDIKPMAQSCKFSSIISALTTTDIFLLEKYCSVEYQRYQVSSVILFQSTGDKAMLFSTPVTQASYNKFDSIRLIGS